MDQFEERTSSLGHGEQSAGVSGVWISYNQSIAVSMCATRRYGSARRPVATKQSGAYPHFYNSMAIGALLDRKARKLGAWSGVSHARNRNRENFCWRLPSMGFGKSLKIICTREIN